MVSKSDENFMKMEIYGDSTDQGYGTLSETSSTCDFNEIKNDTEEADEQTDFKVIIYEFNDDIEIVVQPVSKYDGKDNIRFHKLLTKSKKNKEKKLPWAPQILRPKSILTEMPSQGLTKMQGLGLGKQPETIKIPTTETYAVPKKQKPLLSGEIKKEPESYRNVMVETKFVKKQEEKSLLDEQIKQEPEICRSLTACTHSVKQEKTSFFNQQIKNDTEVSNKITETYSSNQHQKSWIDFVNKKIKEEAEASKPNAQNIYSLIQEKKPWLKNSFSSEFDKFLLYKKDPSLIPKPIPEPVKPKMSIEERLKNRCAVYYAGFELCARVRPRENKRTGLSNQQILFRQKILNSPSIRPKRPCDDIHQNTFKIVKHNEKVLLDRLRTCDIEEDTYPLNEKIVEWQYNQLKRYWQYNIYATRSKIHGTGLFAARRLQKCCMIIEYIGEIIRSEVAECRERKNLMKNRLTYMFRLDEDRVVDAMYHGSLARYINHSCDPNCFAEIIELKGDLRIILFAKRDIYENEELTYDYRLDKEDESQKIACLCKSSKCRKYMN